MTPTDIIADELAKEFPSAAGILAALAARGYHFVQDGKAKVTPGHVVLA